MKKRSRSSTSTGCARDDDWFYFTNSNQGTFARGCAVGGLEVLARSPDAAQIYDDFAVDAQGNAYVAVH